ncbi:hypothetical protein C8R46DRAFT_1350205 [Mycena filopes]|nr:hypothetical protein C8R46DRAFT_1350205 [Mycena filopes]
MLGSARLGLLFRSAYAFPALKELKLRARGSLEWPEAEVKYFFDALPALEEFTLRTQYRQTLGNLTRAFPVSRYSYLPGTEVSLASGVDGRYSRFTGHVQSPVTVLRFRHCTQVFSTDILNSLSTPSVTELSIIQDFCGEAFNLASFIIPFSSRSGCTLTSLCLNIRIQDSDLLAILEQPHVRGLVHLDLSFDHHHLDTKFAVSTPRLH